MLLLNFGHPLTDAQLACIRKLTGRAIERVIAVPTHFDHARPFDEQVRELLTTVSLTPEQWQTTPLLINPPSLAPITAVCQLRTIIRATASATVSFAIVA